MAGVDALLLPTTPHRAFPHGQPAPASQADFTALANATCLPAIAFPFASADGGLPASAQLVGHPFAEGKLIAIAKAIDRYLNC
jgi:aspartyl-tRNA(Asn)/glutamyl-tRNA(Gln) amidotransferase subunit A